MVKTAFITCKALATGGKSKGEVFSELTVEQAKETATYLEEVALASKTGRAKPPPPEDSLGREFYDSIRVSCKQPEHTAEHASDARTQVWSMQNFFGKPTFW